MDAEEGRDEEEVAAVVWKCISDGRKQLYGSLLYGMFLEYRARRSIRFANQAECVSLCVCVCVFVCLNELHASHWST